MSASATVIAALKFQGGVVIAADSQTTDMVARVRWSKEKLQRVSTHPIVVGLGGSQGMGDRVRDALRNTKFHPNMFKKGALVRDAIDRCFKPVYAEIKTRNGMIDLGGLSVFWAEDSPHILEHEQTRDCCSHEYFHAIGSGCQTAYAIWRTLGGRQLSRLNEAKALMVLLRILTTCVGVEMFGVSEPIVAWVISSSGARQLSRDEKETHLQWIDAWMQKEQRVLFDT